MTDEQAFIEAIRARPDDDLPRLVYADWLDEQGDHERAEFVRVQCDLAGLTIRSVELVPGGAESHEVLKADVERYESLRRREAELLAAGRVAWCDALPAGWEWPAFRRGFIDSVTCPAAAWLAHGDAILAAHPVRTVRLTTLPTAGPPDICNLGQDPRSRAFRYHVAGADVLIPEQELLDCWRGEELATRERAAIQLMLSARWPGVGFVLPRGAELVGIDHANGESRTVVTRISGRGMEIDLTGRR